MHKHSSHCTRGLTLEERLLHYLPTRLQGRCWIWTGTITKHGGYGVLNIGKKQYKAHRAAYETWVGPIPDGLTLDHVKARGCTSRLCCNPEHLEPVTSIENVMRGESPPMIFGRQTHCVNGHPFAGENLKPRRMRDGRVYRDCRECSRERVRRYQARKRAHSRITA